MKRLKGKRAVVTGGLSGIGSCQLSAAQRLLAADEPHEGEAPGGDRDPAGVTERASIAARRERLAGGVKRRLLQDELGVDRQHIVGRGYWKLDTVNHPDHDYGESN